MEINNQIIAAAAGPERMAQISRAAAFTDEISILRIDSAAHLLEMVSTREVLMVIADEKETPADIREIGTMLLSCRQVQDIFLLVIAEMHLPEKFRTDFRKLRLDQIPPDFPIWVLEQKIKLIFELFAHRQALEKSAESLDIANRQILAMQEKALTHQENSNKTALAMQKYVSRFQNDIRALQSGLQRLGLGHSQDQAFRNAVQLMRQPVENLRQTVSRITHLNESALKSSEKKIPDRLEAKILYISPSGESFHIFSQFAAKSFRVPPEWAAGMAEALEKLKQVLFDLIFIETGSGPPAGEILISKMKQLRIETPVIIGVPALQDPAARGGIPPEAAAAFSIETLSAEQLKSIVHAVLQKQQIKEQMEKTMGQVALFLRKDRFSGLPNRAAFIERLSVEIERARRHNLDLSILLLSLCQTPAANSADPDQASVTGSTFFETISDISTLTRSGDFLCRIQKTVLGIILPHTGTDGTQILDQRLRTRLAGRTDQTAAVLLDREQALDASGFLDIALNQLNNPD